MFEFIKSLFSGSKPVEVVVEATTPVAEVKVAVKKATVKKPAAKKVEAVKTPAKRGRKPKEAK